MAQPPSYSRGADFSEYALNNPSAPYNGALHDSEFDAVKATLDVTLANLELIQRDDGKLGDLTVEVHTLTRDVLNLIGGFVIRGTWVTATAYAVDDIVDESGSLYLCKTAHTAGTFATDLAAGKWVKFGFGTSADATASAAAALASANAAASSATQASNSAASAAASATSATASKDLATTSATNAVASATAAAASAAAALGSSFPAGTRMSFNQTAAPTGWTKETSATYNDAALRIVTGTVTTGGVDAFSAHFGTNKSTASHVLTVANMPANFFGDGLAIQAVGVGSQPVASAPATFSLQASGQDGGGTGHSHGLPNFNIKFVDFIIATKN